MPHALLVVAGYIAVFGWLYARPVLNGTFLAESDLYEYYLPIFLSPITTWSHFEFSGLPAFADPGDFTSYPLHFLFARLFGWPALAWTALSVSAFVLAGCFTYAYVHFLTRSRSAAAFAGLAFGLSEAMMERLAHSGTLHAAAWLPLILLAIEHVRETAWQRWLVVGSVAVACCLLAGHPQPALYIYYCCGLYALLAGTMARERLPYYLRVAGMFSLGGLLTLVKSLPFVEASSYMERQGVNLGQFTSHANSPAQMLSMFFPTILHEGREAPTYVGIITLGLACIGARHGWRTTWRVPFWIGILAFALLLGAGDSTPLANLAFYLPLYGKFRASARHLFLAAFGFCVLAGLAVAAIERGAVSRRTIGTSVAIVLAIMGAGAVVIGYAPHLFEFEPRPPLPWAFPIWNEGIWVQFLVGLASFGLISAAYRFGRTRTWIAVVMALLFADTLYSLPYRVGTEGLVPITIRASDAQPSVHATRLAALVEPLHQRVLSPGGTHRDAVIPAAWARRWQIPIAGGYGPMLLRHYTALAQIGTNGSVQPAVLAPDDVALDLLAVGRIVMKAEDLTTPATFEREGLTWSAPPLDITVGRADCAHAYPRTLSLPLPAEIEIAELALVGHLRCAEGFATGTEVLRLEMRDAAGPVHEARLQAGVDIADRALAEPSVASRGRHKPTHVFDDPEATPYEYLVRIRPPTPVRASNLVLHVPPITGWVAIDRLTVVDSNGRSVPLSISDLFLNRSDRWVETERFDTSRTTDRGRDERIDGESGYVVFENKRAQPRAWMVGDVVPLGAADLAEAVRHGQLPDGRQFDPRVMALVDRDEVETPRHFAPGNASVTIASIHDGHIVINVTSGGGFLVLSETFYPGWRARVGDTQLQVDRTNLGLQGVIVPAGAHQVEFEFVSTSLRVGTGLSAVGLLVCFVLLVRPGRGTRIMPAQRP